MITSTQFSKNNASRTIIRDTNNTSNRNNIWNNKTRTYANQTRTYANKTTSDSVSNNANLQLLTGNTNNNVFREATEAEQDITQLSDKEQKF